MRIVLAMVAVLLLAGCQRHADVSADHGWVRLPGVAGRPGAAYFTVHGGDKPNTLLTVSSKLALRAEMHETMPDMSMPTEHGMDPGMTMAAIKDVAVPAGGDVAFAPGGKHVMLFDIAPKVKAGDTVPLALQFADGKTVQLQAKAIGAGDPPPN